MYPACLQLPRLALEKPQFGTKYGHFLTWKSKSAWTDFSSHVTTIPYFEWTFCVFIQEHAELADADSEVTVSELVRDVEAKGSKLASLKGHSMEHTQREEEQLELTSLEWNKIKKRRISSIAIRTKGCLEFEQNYVCIT